MKLSTLPLWVAVGGTIFGSIDALKRGDVLTARALSAVGLVIGVIAAAIDLIHWVVGR
jgi:hypothetical protein